MPNQSNLPDTQASLLSAEQPKQAPIGIMAALEQEIAAILKSMEHQVAIRTVADRRYHLAESTLR